MDIHTHRQTYRPHRQVTQQLVLALIISRLDYCNSVLAALPTSTLQPLQSVQNAAVRPCHTDPDPAALAAGQLQNKVQAVLPRPRHPLWSQRGISDGNGPVSRRQQIPFWATFIFHLVDGLFSTTAAHEVPRAGIFTCRSCHLERSAQPHSHRG